MKKKAILIIENNEACPHNRLYLESGADGNDLDICFIDGEDFPKICFFDKGECPLEDSE